MQCVDSFFVPNKVKINETKKGILLKFTEIFGVFSDVLYLSKINGKNISFRLILKTPILLIFSLFFLLRLHIK